MGTDCDGKRLLCTSDLHRAGMDGIGVVVVAIVDTDIKVSASAVQGKNPNVDVSNSRDCCTDR